MTIYNVRKTKILKTNQERECKDWLDQETLESPV